MRDEGTKKRILSLLCMILLVFGTAISGQCYGGELEEDEIPIIQSISDAADQRDGLTLPDEILPSLIEETAEWSVLEEETDARRQAYEEKYHLNDLPEPAAVETDGMTEAPVALNTMSTERRRVACGYAHYIFLKLDGTVVTWGLYNDQSYNFNYGLPDYPMQTVRNLDQVVSVSASDAFGTALKADGTVWVWGVNNSGGSLVSEPVQMGSLSDVVAIDAGGTYNLALKADGTVWEWGENDADEPLEEPIAITDASGAILQNIVSISVGESHSLALAEDGSVYAWGDNFYGQLGDGARSGRSYAEPVMENAGTQRLSGVTKIAAKDGYSMIEKQDGTLWAWGKSDDVAGLALSEHLWYAEDLDSVSAVAATDAQSSFSELPPAGSVSDIAGDGTYTGLALCSDGTVWKKGAYTAKIIETGDLYEPFYMEIKLSATPWAEVEELSTKTVEMSLSASAFNNSQSMAVVNNLLFASGDNQWGQLGNGSYVSSNSPVAVTDYLGNRLSYIKKVSCGYGFTVFLLDDDTVWAVGLNDNGTLGNADKGTNKNEAEPVKGANGNGRLREFRDISAGYKHAIAVKKDGSVWAWGNNSVGQLGDGTKTTSDVPVRVKGANGEDWIKTAAAAYANASCSMVLNADGTVYAWGNNDKGQLGDGTTTNRRTPVQVRGKDGYGYLDNIKQIATAEGCSLALDADGAVWSWGGNQNGRLGGGDTRYFPDKVLKSEEFGGGELENIVSISAGYYHNAALDSDGNLWAWGKNNMGQLGIGSTDEQDRAVKVKGINGEGFLDDIQSVSCGREYTMAIRNDGTILAWGYNRYGQFGIGSSNNRSLTPIIAFEPYTIADDYGDSWEQATPVTFDSNTMGELNRSDDVDWFSFTTEPGGLYKLVLSREEAAVNFQVYTVEQGELKPFQDCGTGAGLTFRAQAAAEYSIKIDSATGTLSRYTLSLRDLTKRILGRNFQGDVNSQTYFSDFFKLGRLYRDDAAMADPELVSEEQSLWLTYVSGVIYMNTNGTLCSFDPATNTKTELVAVNAQYICTDGDYLYYSNFSDEGKIYRYHIGGHTNERVCNDTALWLRVEGDVLAYNCANDSSRKYTIDKTATDAPQGEQAE